MGHVLNFVGRSKLQIRSQSINKKRTLHVREWNQTIEESEHLHPRCSANGHRIKARGKANPTPPPIESEPSVQARRKQEREVKADRCAATAPENGFGSDAQRRSDELWQPPRARVDGGGSTDWGRRKNRSERYGGLLLVMGQGRPIRGRAELRARTVGRRPRRVRLVGPGSVGPS
jgi:hypothetical protein